MPRKGRGGKRKGREGQAYTNRTDLTGAGTATHMPSSVRPFANETELPNLPLPEDRPPAAAPQPGTPGPQLAPPTPVPLPGEGPGLADPSMSDEPLTAGMPVGPGPGPEALGPFAPDAPTMDMVELAQYLPTLELLAMQPGTSNKVRNLVRVIKAALPPELRMPRG